MSGVEKFPPIAPNFTSSSQYDLLVWMERYHRELGSIFRSRAYGASVFVITEPQHVEHVLRRNWQNYRRGRQIKRFRMLMGRGLVVSEGELWKQQRRMMQPAFHEQTIYRLTELIEQENGKLLNRWLAAAQRAQAVNVTRETSVTILDIVLKIIFGSDYDRVVTPFSILSEEVERTLHFAQEFRALGQRVRIVLARRRHDHDNADDMLGMLMRARDRDTGEGMSDSQIVDEVLTLLVAGHETTASTLNWLWYLLSQHLEVAAKLYAEVSTTELGQLTYARWIIEETMRMYPALWFFTRQAIDQDVLGEYVVPARTEIFISPYVIQRRDDLWPEPDQFIPERFDPAMVRHPMAFIPFSAGPRNCIGEHLARWEMLIHLSMIARKLRLRYLGDQPEYDVGINLRTKDDLWMLPIVVN